MLQTLRKRLEKDEAGFTLIELMVVVLIIAILLAIAIPTFLGARERAQDRAAQSNIRNGFTAAKTFYTDNEKYTESTTALSAIEPSLTFVTGATPSVVKSVYAKTFGTVADSGIYVSARSASTRCFYLKDDGATATSFAKTDKVATCAAADAATLTYSSTGW